MSFDIDPELAPYLPYLPSLDLSDVQGMRNILADIAAKKKEFISSTELSVEEHRVSRGPEEASVKVRRYRPQHTNSSLPGILYMHGGGFVAGDLEMSDAWARRLAADVGAVVVSVDYSLSPEAVFPTALEDCYASLEWMTSKAPRLGLDANRIAVAGDSAGANLAAATAILARDRNGPKLCFQSLSIPALDDRLSTESAKNSTDTPLWTSDRAAQAWAYYLGNEFTRGSDNVPVLAAPARLEDLQDLPPAFIATCEFDPHRDEAIEYGMRLVQADVRTEMHLYPRTFHSSRMFEDAEVSKRMIDDCVGAFQRAFA